MRSATPVSMKMVIPIPSPPTPPSSPSKCGNILHVLSTPTHYICVERWLLQLSKRLGAVPD